jgi:hypothetical protein
MARSLICVCFKHAVDSAIGSTQVRAAVVPAGMRIAGI